MVWVFIALEASLLSLSMNNGSKIVFNEYDSSLTVVLEEREHYYQSAIIIDFIISERVL